jgi:hypothetical protein
MAGATGAASNGAGATRGPVMPQDPAALEQLISARRERLATTVDELVQRAQPREIARRGAQDAATRFRAAVRTPDGRLRIERVGAVAAAAVTLLVLVVWRRRSR